MKSWQTTVAGIAAFIGALGFAVQAYFDGDPTTVPDWALVGSMLAACVGLFYARDNDKSSEQVGAKGK